MDPTLKRPELFATTAFGFAAFGFAVSSVEQSDRRRNCQK
jgi:hypothetical protein